MPTRPTSTRPLYLDADDDVPPTQRPFRWGLWVTALIALAVGAGAALQWERVAPMVGLADEADGIAPFLADGDAALSKDTREGYEEAIREYTRATALNERDVRVQAALSRAHSASAQLLSLHASDLEARSALDATLAGEAAALRRQQETHSDQARRFAEDAVRQEPNRLDAVIALAMALQLTGDPQGAGRHLDRARALVTQPSADLHYVAGWLAMTAADGDAAAARDDAARAVEINPAMLRARLLLARAHLGEGAVDAATQQLTSITEDAADHEPALHLLASIEEGLPPAAPVVAIVDAGAPPATPIPTRRAPTEARSQDTTDEPAPSTPRRDYDSHIRRGDAALERGDIGRARQAFELALQLRPGGIEAFHGLGYLALETNNPGAAVSHFQRAANAGYADAFIGLGTAYRRMGRKPAAITAFEGYLERNPGGSQANIARRQLEALRATAIDDEPQAAPAVAEPEDAPDAPTVTPPPPP